MKNSGALAQKWNQFVEKLKSLIPEKKTKIRQEIPSQEEEQGSKAKRILSTVWKVVFAFRRLVLAVPVIIAALRLAAYNRENLPVLVGINLQSNGEFAQMISRDTAVSVPLMITLGCLSLLLFTRKTIYPWLISIFTLAIPVLLALTNIYLG